MCMYVYTLYTSMYIHKNVGRCAVLSSFRLICTNKFAFVYLDPLLCMIAGRADATASIYIHVYMYCFGLV